MQGFQLIAAVLAVRGLSGGMMAQSGGAVALDRGGPGLFRSPDEAEEAMDRDGAGPPGSQA
jgi:hypothetical protein